MACEKCWADAYLRMRELGGSQADHYHDLLNERENNPCSTAEQNGVDPQPAGSTEEK